MASAVFYFKPTQQGASMSVLSKVCRRLSLSCTLLCAFPAAVIASETPRHGHTHSHTHSHGAHAHGKGELELLVDGQTIQGVFRTPMDSLVGFEHAPKTDSQRNAVDSLRKRLANPAAILSPNLEAQCTAKYQEAISTLFTGAVKGGHSDLEYRFTFVCAQPTKLSALELVALKEFKRLSEVRVQLVTGSAQKALVLRKRDPRVILSTR
jgi:hypothetical protein